MPEREPVHLEETSWYPPILQNDDRQRGAFQLYCFCDSTADEMDHFDPDFEPDFDETWHQIESNDPNLVELYVGDAFADVPRDGGWGRLGTCIGRNTHLRELTLYGYNLQFEDGDLDQFFRGVALSQSIQKLDFQWCDLFGGEVFRTLFPLFKSNQVVCLRFEDCGPVNDDGDCEGMSPECSRSLATSLAEFESLNAFELNGGEVDDNGTKDLIRALAGHSGLSELNLTRNTVGRNAFAALAVLLQCPNSKISALALYHLNGINDEGADLLAPGLAASSTLRDLDLRYNSSITEMGWRAIFAALRSASCRLENLSLKDNSGINDATAVFLSRTLRNNNTLKSLDMNSCRNITIAGWRALFGFLRSPNSSLEELDLGDVGIDDAVTIHLSNALMNNSVLRSLCLDSNSGITTTGWQAFSAVIESTNSGLEKLCLHSNMINDEAINAIANALVNNTKLRELNLSDNIHVTATGWQAFFSVIESPHSALETLDLHFIEINNGTLTSLANSVANNSKLKELSFHLEDGNGNTLNGLDAFSRALCSTSSIMDTYQSNHTLEKVSFEEDRLPQDLKLLLQLNRDNINSQTARLKIIKSHFSGGFTVHPFVNMERNVLPHAIAWMGRDGRSNETTNHLYEFIRGVPLIF